MSTVIKNLEFLTLPTKMTDNDVLSILKNANKKNQMLGILPESDIGKCMIQIVEEVQKYRSLGSVEEIKRKLEELERWHTEHINPKIRNVFAYTSTLICHNCDHKDEYIEEMEAELKEYHVIGTPEECRTAAELQKAKKPPVIDRPNIFVKVPVCPNCSTKEHYVPLYGIAATVGKNWIGKI